MNFLGTLGSLDVKEILWIIVTEEQRQNVLPTEKFQQLLGDLIKTICVIDENYT